MLEINAIITQLIALIVVLIAGFIAYLILKPHLFKRMRLTDLKICPKCGSTTIRTITNDNKQAGIIMGGSPEISLCMNCKNEGVFPIIHEDDVAAFQQIIKEEKQTKKNSKKKN